MHTSACCNNKNITCIRSCFVLFLGGKGKKQNQRFIAFNSGVAFISRKFKTRYIGEAVAILQPSGTGKYFCQFYSLCNFHWSL